MATTSKNKVKFNIRNVYYAKLTINEDDTYEFDTPVPMPGAVSLSLDPNGEPSVFYADGYAYYTISNNQGYEGDLELALVPESFRKDILKESLDDNNVLIESAQVDTEKFALLFEFEGDVKKIRHVLYNCIASRPTIESATKEDEIEVKTETLTITASPLQGGYVKARTSDNTDTPYYNNWFNKVYIPGETITYTVRFLNYAGDDVLKTVIAEVGSDITKQAPTPEVIEGKTFKEWNQDITNIQSDMTIRPVYEDAAEAATSAEE